MKSKSIIIKVRVNYIYNPSQEHPCQAEIFIYLPCEHYGKIISELESTYTKKYGNGYFEDGYMYNSATLFACNWKELKVKVEEEIDDEIAKIQSIYKLNTKMLRTKPKDEINSILLI